MMRFTADGRYVPFDVLGTGEEGTRIPGDRISVRCARCGKPLVLPSSLSLGEVVDRLEAGRRFRHRRCVREVPALTAESA
jgi:hypothetical protein